jgi:O-antigen biosynthesis protein
MIEPHTPKSSIAIRTVDLSQPLRPLTDVSAYPFVRVYVIYNSRPLGHIDITNRYQSISATRLREAIANRFALKLLEFGSGLNKNTAWSDTQTALIRHFVSPDTQSKPTTSPEKLSSDVVVSVVVATYDRPHDLRECLRCLTAQVSSRRIEIVVVDNNPTSGLTPPVVAEFPGVVLVSEPRKGLSYARNTGFTISTGDIVIATDDDVTMPPDWLEKLVAPFGRRDVAIVTGNVLPLELETKAQRLFETYGGLGRGFERFEVNREWFDHFNHTAVPTWKLGATANAAFRATIFSHPQIGLLDEALGAGTPTGCSEDTDLFYKVLKVGHTIVYQPEAYVWHRHRRDMAALRKQIYNYSKGHVAYHLITLLRDRDLRALRRLVVELPQTHLQRIKDRLLRRSPYPVLLILLEIKGNLAGLGALWQSRQRVKRLGRSQLYIPVAQRSADLPKQQFVTSSGGANGNGHAGSLPLSTHLPSSYQSIVPTEVGVSLDEPKE